MENAPNVIEITIATIALVGMGVTAVGAVLYFLTR